MTVFRCGQLAGAVMAAGTPWLVVRIVCSVASRQVRAVELPFAPPRTVRTLVRVTIPVMLLVGAIAMSVPAPSPWMLAVDGAAFLVTSVLGLRALSDIGNASSAWRDVPARARWARVTPRRVGDYLPWSMRLLPAVSTIVGGALFALRTLQASGGRRLFVPIGFALAAPVFLYLYETWIRELVTSPVVDGEARLDHLRRRWVRLVSAAELAVIVALMATAHVLLDLDWSMNGASALAFAFTAALAGIIGCALPLASPLLLRRYALVEDPRT